MFFFWFRLEYVNRKTIYGKSDETPRTMNKTRSEKILYNWTVSIDFTLNVNVSEIMRLNSASYVA